MDPLPILHLDHSKDPQQRSQKLRSIQKQINRGNYSSRYLNEPWGFTISNKKKAEFEKLRDKQIQREDKALNVRIVQIRENRRHSSHNEVESIYLNNPLHSSIRKGYNKIVLQENIANRKRIQDLKPTINIRKNEKDWQSKEELKKFLQKYYSNEAKGKSTSIDLSKIQNMSQQKIVKFSKERLLNGVMVLIKIQQYQNTILISGQIKQRSMFLLIKVQKDKIQSIIDNDCKGKVQKLGSLLKFDTHTNCLYYIPEESEKGESLISQKISEFQLKHLRSLLKKQHLLIQRKNNKKNDLDKVSLQKSQIKQPSQQPIKKQTQVQQSSP